MDTYTIAKVIYGCEFYLNEKADIPESLQALSELLKDHFKNKTPGFLQFRSNNFGETSTAFGIVLDEFNENDSVVLSTKKLSASDEDKKSLDSLLEVLEPEVKDFFKSFAPKELLLWTTSEPETKEMIRQLCKAVYTYTYYYEAWNHTGSREDRESKAYNEAIVDSLTQEYYDKGYSFDIAVCNAEHIAIEDFWKSRDEDREDYDPRYDMQAGLAEFLRTLD